MKWAHYDKNTGFIGASLSKPVSDDALSARGYAQVEIPDDLDITRYKINLGTLAPEELPPPPPQPLGMMEHIFVALVNKGEINLADVDDSVLAPLNISLKHSGKPELIK